MKWIKPTSGDTRNREGFLWLPKGYRVIRWLEYGKWWEIYVDSDGWTFEDWIDDEDE